MRPVPKDSTGPLPHLYLTTAAAVWGGTIVGGKYAVGDVSPLAIAWLRLLLSWVILCLVLSRNQRGWLKDLTESVPIFFFLGATGAALPSLLLLSGLQYTTASSAAIIQAGNPVLSALLATIFLRERTTLLQWVGIVLSLVGVATVVTEGSTEAIMGLQINLGNLLVAGAMASWAVNSVVSRVALYSHTPLGVSTHAIFFGWVILTPLALWQNAPESLGAATPLSWIVILYMGIFGNALGQLLWFRGIASVGVSRSAVYTNLIPVSALALASLLLGERLTIAHWVGAVLVALGVTLTVSANKEKESAPTAVEGPGR